ncbi:glycoside hydrolase superfamily [Aspergillus oleicola]
MTRQSGIFTSGMPYQNLVSMGGRLVSEFGMEAYPHMYTIDAFIDNLDEKNFKVKQDFKSYLHLSQLAQSETMAIAYKSWRRQWGSHRKRRCVGVLVWQLNDCWPTISWAVVGYFHPPSTLLLRRLGPWLSAFPMLIADGSRDMPGRPRLQIRFISIGSGEDIRAPLEFDDVHIEPNSGLDGVEIDASNTVNPGWEITCTLPSSYWYMQNFNLKSMQKYISFFNIMSYDYHVMEWDPMAGDSPCLTKISGQPTLSDIKTYYDPVSIVKYNVYNGTNGSPTTMRSHGRTMKYLTGKSFSGVMIWALDQDDGIHSALTALLGEEALSGSLMEGGDLSDDQKEDLTDQLAAYTGQNCHVSQFCTDGSSSQRNDPNYACAVMLPKSLASASGRRASTLPRPTTNPPVPAAAKANEDLMTIYAQAYCCPSDDEPSNCARPFDSLPHTPENYCYRLLVTRPRFMDPKYLWEDHYEDTGDDVEWAYVENTAITTSRALLAMRTGTTRTDL